MPALETLLAHSASLHTSLCPRQVLGVRMGMLAGERLGLDLPQKDKRLFVIAETDGCTTDGISVATGCWVGRRTMRIVDFGKIGATFLDTRTGAAIRISPHPQARPRSKRYAAGAQDEWHAYLQGYKIMPLDELFVVQPVRIAFSIEDWISEPEAKAVCAQCGEEIFNGRQVERDGRTLCRACAGEMYYKPLQG